MNDIGHILIAALLAYGGSAAIFYAGYLALSYWQKRKRTPHV